MRIREHVEKLTGARVIAIDPLAPDSGATSGSSAKAAGYGEPMRITLADGRRLVFRVAGINEFGHDRRSDRAAETFLAYDDFPRIPRHIRPVDIGAIRSDGDLISLRDVGELYLVTTYAPGTIYADELRRVAKERVASERDLARVETLAEYLAALHAPVRGNYRRAIRDLVGHGEGIYGIVDGYPDGVVEPARLRAIEERCASWRWRLREHASRMTRTHGDFHPFNIVFAGDEPTLLDASRGGCGDPADDLTALAVNFVLFAIDDKLAWPRGLGVLWHRWWERYSELRFDRGLLAAAPPFFAWRTLVVCNPRFYPRLSARGRDALLGFAERALEAGRLEPARVEELFA